MTTDFARCALPLGMPCEDRPMRQSPLFTAHSLVLSSGVRALVLLIYHNRSSKQMLGHLYWWPYVQNNVLDNASVQNNVLNNAYKTTC